MSDTDTAGDTGNEERQCRICFDGPGEDLSDSCQSGANLSYKRLEGGRLIRPCHCRGSIAVCMLLVLFPG